MATNEEKRIEHLEIRYGPSAPPVAEQLEIDPENECENDYVTTAQIVLDAIAEGRRKNTTSPEYAAVLRQEVVERLIAKFHPNWKSSISNTKEYNDGE